MGLDGFGAGPWMMDFGPDTHFYQAETHGIFVLWVDQLL